MYLWLIYLLSADIKQFYVEVDYGPQSASTYTVAETAFSFVTLNPGCLKVISIIYVYKVNSFPET